MDNALPPHPRSIFPRWFWVLAGLGITGFVLFELRGALTPIFFAFLIAYGLNPVVDALERRKVPRGAAIAILLVPALAAFAAFALFAVPSLVREIAEFASKLPEKLEALMGKAKPWLTKMGVTVPHSVGELLEQMKLNTTGVAGGAVKPATAVLGWIAGQTASVFGVIISVLTVPIFSFYLLYDFDRIRHAVRGLIPWRARPRTLQILREIDVVLGQFIRGQLLVMLILAALYAAAYAIAGVRLAVVIGIAGGLLSFIPYVGSAMSVGLAILITLLDGKGWQSYLMVVGAWATVQALESFVITPRIMGDKVGLSAVWVMFALLVGAEAFGFFGVLLAVPSAAVAKILLTHATKTYKESKAFSEGQPPPEPPPAPDAPAT